MHYRDFNDIKETIGVGHRKGKSYDKSAYKFDSANKTYLEVYNSILLKIINVLNFLSDSFWHKVISLSL